MYSAGHKTTHSLTHSLTHPLTNKKVTYKVHKIKKSLCAVVDPKKQRVFNFCLKRSKLRSGCHSATEVF